MLCVCVCVYVCVCVCTMCLHTCLLSNQLIRVFHSNTGGTLFAKIVDNLKEDKVFTQLDLQRLIVHIAKVCQATHPAYCA